MEQKNALPVRREVIDVPSDLDTIFRTIMEPIDARRQPRNLVAEARAIVNYWAQAVPYRRWLEIFVYSNNRSLIKGRADTSAHCAQLLWTAITTVEPREPKSVLLPSVPWINATPRSYLYRCYVCGMLCYIRAEDTFPSLIAQQQQRWLLVPEEPERLPVPVPLATVILQQQKALPAKDEEETPTAMDVVEEEDEYPETPAPVSRRKRAVRRSQRMDDFMYY